MRFLKNITAVSFSVMLAACGTLVGGQTQTITLATPGAYEAECTLDNGSRYSLSSGQTIEVMRSASDLVADCYGSGNRHIVKRIPSTYNDWSTANIANGVLPGMAYDHVAGALYEYPSVVTVDFTGTPAKGFELPEYHNKDVPNPYDTAIEDYGPGTARIPYDNAYMKRGVEKRNPIADSNPFATTPSDSFSPAASAPVNAPAASSPVPRGSNADELTRSMNPGVFN